MTYVYATSVLQDMENALRRRPMEVTPAHLRTQFAELCVRRGAGEAAPLLGDVVLLTAMTDDLRGGESSEAEVRKVLVADLTARLRGRWWWRLVGWRGMCDAEVDVCLQYAYHLAV